MPPGPGWLGRVLFSLSRRCSWSSVRRSLVASIDLSAPPLPHRAVRPLLLLRQTAAHCSFLSPAILRPARQLQRTAAASGISCSDSATYKSSKVARSLQCSGAFPSGASARSLLADNQCHRPTIATHVRSGVRSLGVVPVLSALQCKFLIMRGGGAHRSTSLPWNTSRGCCI